MRGGSARTSVRAACLQNEDGLEARGCPRCRHEFSAMHDAFDIEQYGESVLIRGEIVEHVAKVDIRHISQ